MVTVEFFGVPRHRAGTAELRVPAGSAADVLAAVERACPGLAGVVQPGGRLSPNYLLSRNGTCFVSDLRQAVESGERLWLLSADAGG